MKEKLLIFCALICLILNAGCTNEEVVKLSKLYFYIDIP